VADDHKPSSELFDVDLVQQLLRLMRRFDLSEMDLQDGERRLRLRRGAQAAATPFGAAPQAAAIPVGVIQANSQPAANPSANRQIEIKSNMVGNFYAKPAPEKDDYVKVGSRVNPETIVCKIEAMKIFNDLPAGCSGIIAEVCAQNGDYVEYDQVLFRVDPS
jgi:acetyl-CoA carboxylase biotin carboxyl carrier protein